MSEQMRARDPNEFTRPRDSKVETMMSARGITPWHELGKVVEGTPSSEDAIRFAGLDWEVLKEPLVLKNPRWDGLDVPAWATVRGTDGRIFGIVGERYTVLQNREAFQIADALFEQGARWETAGALDKGGRVWMLCRLQEEPEADEVVPGDQILTYLLFVNRHDGLGCVQVLPTTVRVVCRNTVRLALGENKDRIFSIRHTEGVLSRARVAAELIKAAAGRKEKFIADARELARVKVPRQRQVNYLRSTLKVAEDKEKRTPQQQKRLDEAITRLERQINDTDTAWALFNTVTEMTNWSGRVGRSEGMERLFSVVDGTGDKTNQRAWREALELV